jgi:hypothetical protein
MTIRNSKFRITILLFFFICFFNSLTWSSDDSERMASKMPFKLDFEFQESSSLCKWAEDDVKVQKKPLFFLNEQGTQEPLWHVVIDASDIEFVTRPFLRGEGDQAETCMKSLVESFQILQQRLTLQKEITFDEWVNELLKMYNNSSFLISCSQEDYKSIGSMPITPYREKLKEGEENFLENWKPIFSPQVTIQHPLEFTIPLYFGLFGFTSRYMIPFSASILGRDFLLQMQEQANSQKFWQIMHGLQQKTMGIIFLHALTLVQMTPVIESSDADCLQETRTYLDRSSQVDAKMMLTLMSRRPFSAMWKDINSNTNYVDLFKNFMGFNSSFSHSYQVPTRFKDTNYAEQFFDSLTSKPRDFTILSGCFNNDFYTANKENLLYLLGKGVVSTTMIRNFKEEIKLDSTSNSVSDLLSTYYDDAINTVYCPKKRYIIDLVDNVVRSVDFKYDTLSPPHLLNEDNSMGNFKETVHDALYGEAVIEVRGIRDVQPWFLRKCDLEESISGRFLTNPDKRLIEQARKLFIFLVNFGTVEDFQDIALAMPFALRKYN